MEVGMETGIHWNNPMIYIGLASVSLAFLGLVITVGIALFKAGKWVNGMNAIKETVGRIEGKIDRLMERFMGVSLGSDTIAGQSPISLTDKGLSISRSLSVRNWADTLAPQLVTRVSGKMNYEVQQFSFEYAKGTEFQPSDELQRKTIDRAYNHGTTVDQVKDVYAIELRDALLRLLSLGPRP